MNRFALSFVVCIWIGATPLGLALEPLFNPAPAVTVGLGSGEILLLDINRDGHVDLLTKHLLSRSLSVRLGDGQSHFAPAAKDPMIFDYQPGTIALADVNNDTIPDLGVANRNDSGEYVHLFLGDGQGGFKEVSGSPFATSASMEFYKPGLHFVDLNEDGKPDIVTANGRRNTVETLLGDGRGGFSAGSIVRLEPGQSYYSFDLGDMDGDGHLDLVIASADALPDRGAGRVETRRGNGKGSFADRTDPPLSVLPDPRVATLADLNGDLRLDIVLNYPRANVLGLLVNDGMGAFNQRSSPLNVGMRPFAVAATDVNADKHTDLVVATVNSVAAPFESKIVVLLGDGQEFAPGPGSPFAAGPGAYNLATGDVNQDGKPDIAASSFEGSAVTLLLANPDLAKPSPVQLVISRQGNEIVLTWAAPDFTLEEAVAMTGPWIPLTGQASPLTKMPSGAAKFYRLGP